MEQTSATTINTYFRKYVEKSNVIRSRILKIKNSDLPIDQQQEAITKIDVTFHTLKHSFITRCFVEGKKAEEIVALTGNSDIDTLLKYKSMLENDYTSVADTLNLFRESRMA